MQNNYLKIVLVDSLITFASMQVLKQIAYFYIHGSVHVALAVYALLRLTFYWFAFPFDGALGGFAFFGAITGYNFVKYAALFRARKQKIHLRRKVIFTISLLSFLAATYCFWQLKRQTQIGAIVLLGLTLWYALPVVPGFGNARNWAGIKIYIVAFCWAGLTVLLPVLNAGFYFSQDVWLTFCQFFVLVIVLILIFEIIDLKHDKTSLQTVPQQIGVRKTKLLNLFLLLPFYAFELFKSNCQEKQLWINLILIAVIALFTLFASPKRSRYYTLFWVESVPILWWVMVLL